MPVYYVFPCITWYIMFCFRGSSFELYGADGNASGVITIIDPQDYIDWIETLQLNIHMINTDNVNTVIAFDFPSSIPCTLFQVSHVYKDKLPYCLRCPPSQVHWCSEIDWLPHSVHILLTTSFSLFLSIPRCLQYIECSWDGVVWLLATQSVVVYPLPWPLLVGGVRCSRLWSTSQLLRPSGQQCSHSGGVCPQIQGRQCGAYVGAVEEMMCVVCVDVTEGA